MINIHISYILTCCSYIKTACDRLNNDPKDAHILTPEPILPNMAKGTADMIKLRILTWRHYSGLFKWVEYNHREAEERNNKREGQRKTPRVEAEFKDTENASLLLLKMDEGILSQRMWIASRSWKR